MIAAAALWLVVPALAPFDAKAYPEPRALPAGGLPDDATRAALRAAFVDTQLGAPPPSAKIIPRR